MAIKIFLTDDDSDDRELFSEALREVDGTVVYGEAGSCAEALEYFRNPDFVLPDLLFLDINLPLMNGWDCLKRIKNNARTRNVPVVMYSTSSHEHDVQKAAELGAHCLIAKPSDYTLLKQLLGKVVGIVKSGDYKSLAALGAEQN